MTLPELLTHWQGARQAAEIFGPLDPPTEMALRRRYRALAAQSHPDRHPTARAEASEAFKLLQGWYAVARREVAQGYYGLAPLLDVQVGGHRYVSHGPVRPGDRWDLYPAWAGGERLWVKVARDPRDSDLMEAEARHLRRINAAVAHSPVRAHFPLFVASFRLRDGAGLIRQATVLRAGQRYRRLAAGQGMAPPEMVWLFSRVLAALGTAHDLGIVHGALLPAHILVRPGDRNAKLVEWCYSVADGAPLRAICSRDEGAYPPEVHVRQPVTPATDLFMAAGCMVRLLGGGAPGEPLPPSIPMPLAALLRGCLIPAPARRADDAWAVLAALREAAVRLYGPDAASW